MIVLWFSKENINKILTNGIEILSVPLLLVISAIVEPMEIKIEKNIKFVIDIFNIMYPKIKHNMSEVIKDASVPIRVFLSSHIIKETLFLCFLPTIDAMGSQIAKIKNDNAKYSLWFQKYITWMKYARGKYIVP